MSVASGRGWCSVLSGQLRFCARGGEVGEGGNGGAGRPSVIRLAWVWCQELPLPVSAGVPLAEMGRSQPEEKEPGEVASTGS